MGKCWKDSSIFYGEWFTKKKSLTEKGDLTKEWDYLTKIGNYLIKKGVTELIKELPN